MSSNRLMGPSPLFALRELGRSTSIQSSAMARLSSGVRIQSASDDPAGLAISMKLRSDARVFTQVSRNVNDSISQFNMIDSAIGSLRGISERIMELATQAATGTYSSTQRSALDSEAQALRSEYNRIVASTEFNDQNVFTAEGSSTVGRSYSFALGPNASDYFSVSLSQTTTSTVVQNIGTGTFGSAISFSAAGFTAGANGGAVGDFDGDGDNDIFTHSNTGTNYALFMNNGDGTFKAGTSYTANIPYLYLPKAVDLNGDSKIDIVSFSPFSGEVYTLMGNGNGSFKVAVSQAPSGTTPSLYNAELVDVNNDGKLDFVGTSSNGIYMGLRTLLGNGDGTFKAELSYSVATTATGFNTTLDANGDSFLDVAFIENGGTSLKLALGNGDGSFKAATVHDMGYMGLTAEAGDFNGDSIADVAVRMVAGSGDAMILYGNGNGTFRAAVSYAIDGSGPDTFNVGDVNNDGKLDIFTTYNSEGYVLFGNGNGTFKATNSHYAGVNHYFQGTVHAVDITGDDVPDFVQISGTGPKTILQGSTQGEVTTTISGALGALDSFSLATAAGAADTLNQFDLIMDRLSQFQQITGSTLARLEIAGAHATELSGRLIEAEQKITSIDVAEEVARLVAAQVRSSVVTALLAQANQSAPELIDILLK